MAERARPAISRCPGTCACASRGEEMKTRYLLVILSGVFLMLIAATVFAAVLAETPIDADNPMLQIGIVIVLVFLVMLVLRYFALLWLGYLQHVETQVCEGDACFTPPVTLVIPAYNEGPVIAAAIRSLLELDYPSYEVLVVDDGSTDDTYERAMALEGHYGAATVRVVSKANAGKANALNTGIALARNAFIVCMDGDSRLTPQSLRAAIRHFSDPQVGAVAGNVKVCNRVNLWSKLQALEYIEGLNMARRAQGFVRVVNIIP